MTDATSPFRLGDWEVLPALNRIERDGHTVALQPLSMKILVYLAEHAGSVVENTTLLEHFWPRGVTSDEAIHRRIADIRAKLGDQAKNPRYIETIHKRGYRCIAAMVPVATDPQPPVTPKRGFRVPLFAALAVAASITMVYWALERPAKGEAVAAFRNLLADDRYSDAYLAIRPYLDEVSADPNLLRDFNDVTRPVTILTDVDAARVRYRLAGTESWLDLGQTPIDGPRLPRGVLELVIEHDGYQTLTLLEPNPGLRFNNVGREQLVITLPPTSDGREGMVFVPRGNHRLGLWDLEFPVEVGDFYMDRNEVSNAEFAEFVDAGGYEDPAWWPEGALPELKQKLMDATGRSGPADWEFGRYRSGTADDPVTGVSALEAEAYAKFRGKSLPSVYHWARAALAYAEWKWPVAPAIIPRANLSAAGPVPVTGPGLTETHGTHHLIGNAREWTRTEWNGRRYAIGGSWKDPKWTYNVPRALDPLDRSSENGFRCVVEPAPVTLPPPRPVWSTSAPAQPAVDAERLAEVTRHFAYQPGTITAADATRVSTRDQGAWLRKVVYLPGDDPDDPLPVYIYEPKARSSPLQSILFVPPADSYSPLLVSSEIDIADYQLDFIPVSGRALVWPVYLGTHERYRPFDDAHPRLAIRQRNERLWTRRAEIGRVIDYLDDHPDYDGERIALLGLSLGAAYIAPHVLAFEPRLKAAVLYSVGLVPTTRVVLPEFHPNLYWPRVTQPVLLANGRWDSNRPSEQVFYPLVDLIGTPPDRKRAILYDGASHWPLPRRSMIRDTTQWLDEQLGPVELLVK